MEGKVYKHIGSEHYNPIQVHPEYLKIMPSSGNKPPFSAAMWGSPEGDGYYTWKDWCEMNDYSNPDGAYFLFRIKDGKKIFLIDSVESFNEFEKITKKKPEELNDPMLRMLAKVIPYYDFNNLNDLGYSGVELLISKEHKLKEYLNTWDCDSICIWDPDAVEEVIDNG